MSKPPRRLELRLPYNHPVWGLPDGSRSQIVREWLEIGRKLSTIEDDLKVIKEIISSSEPCSKLAKENHSVNDGNEVEEGFDKNAFLNHFK